jgi:hypothetical protein
MVGFLIRFCLILICVYLLPVEYFWECSQGDEGSVVKIEIPKPNEWSLSPASLVGGTAIYQNSQDQSIVLKSVILSKNLYPEVVRLNDKSTVERIFKVKKTFFKYLGASDYKIQTYRVINRGIYRELELAFQFYYKNRMNYSHEKYFIHPDQTLRLDLSWTSQSREDKVKIAQAEFNILKVKVSH